MWFLKVKMHVYEIHCVIFFYWGPVLGKGYLDMNVYMTMVKYVRNEVLTRPNFFYKD